MFGWIATGIEPKEIDRTGTKCVCGAVENAAATIQYRREVLLRRPDKA